MGSGRITVWGDSEDVVMEAEAGSAGRQAAIQNHALRNERIDDHL